MLIVATIWWVLFLTAVGLTVGSYLNVVVYRVPRGISTTDPMWSFCPGCGVQIHWYDNLPVLSFIHLGGRCRSCGVPISPRYPTVELLTAMIALVVLDALCVSGLRGGVEPWHLGLTDQLYYDWPIVLAHVVLFACLLAMSAIDLEHYFIDIRFTNFAAFIGFAMHLIWSPANGSWRATVGTEWYRPGVTLGAASLAMTLVAGLTWAVMRLVCPPRDEDGEPDTGGEADGHEHPDATFEHEDEEDEAPDIAAAHSRNRWAMRAAVAVGLVFLIVAGALGGDAVSDGSTLFASWRLLIPVGLCFALIVGASAPARASDHEIMEAIEAERFSARQMVARELLILVPAMLAGLVVAWMAARHGAFGEWCTRMLDWAPVGSWRPARGLATAAAGFVIGGGLGWAVRIGFTLVLGREAFGSGDIHLMAAAGCVAGWPVVALGFLLTSFLALLGWAATLPFKRSRAIPLVPWLSLAFLIVVVFYRRLCEFGPVRNSVDLFNMAVSGKLTGLVN